MSHKQQRVFCRQVRRKFRSHFNNVKVLDCGSLDINGNNRWLFSNSDYRGIDIVKGKNVDTIGKASIVLKRFFQVDVVISTEMLEHDKEWAASLRAMYDVLKPGGLLLITCAAPGRPVHGTQDHTPGDSPGTHDYYCNISPAMFAGALPAHLFNAYHLVHESANNDLQFYGIKK